MYDKHTTNASTSDHFCWTRVQKGGLSYSIEINKHKNKTADSTEWTNDASCTSVSYSELDFQDPAELSIPGPCILHKMYPKAEQAKYQSKTPGQPQAWRFRLQINIIVPPTFPGLSLAECPALFREVSGVLEDSILD